MATVRYGWPGATGCCDRSRSNTMQGPHLCPTRINNHDTSMINRAACPE
jgi:hypothetical protein